MVVITYPHLLQKQARLHTSEWGIYNNQISLERIVKNNLPLDGKIELDDKCNILPDDISEIEYIFNKRPDLAALQDKVLLVIKDNTTLEQLVRELFWDTDSHLQDPTEVIYLIKRVAAHRKGATALFRDEIDTMEQIFGCRARSSEEQIKQVEKISLAITKGELVPKLTLLEKILFSKTNNYQHYVIASESFLLKNSIATSRDNIRVLSGKPSQKVNLETGGPLKNNYYLVEVGSPAKVYALRLIYNGGLYMRLVSGINSAGKNSNAGNLADLEGFLTHINVPHSVQKSTLEDNDLNYMRQTNRAPTIEDLKAILVPLAASSMDQMMAFRIYNSPVNISSIGISFDIKFNKKDLVTYTEVEFAQTSYVNNELDEMKTLLTNAMEKPNRKMRKGTVKQEKQEALSTYIAGLYERVEDKIRDLVAKQFENQEIPLTILRDLDGWEYVRNASHNISMEIQEKHEYKVGQKYARSSSPGFSVSSSSIDKPFDSVSMFARVGQAIYEDIKLNNVIYANASNRYMATIINTLVYLFIIEHINGGTTFKWWTKPNRLAPLDESVLGLFEKRFERLIFFVPRQILPRKFIP